MLLTHTLNTTDYTLNTITLHHLILHLLTINGRIHSNCLNLANIPHLIVDTQHTTGLYS